MGNIFVTLFWIADVLDLSFMESFDTTLPLNSLFWLIYFILWYLW